MRDSKEIIIVGVLEDYYERAARIYDGGGVSRQQYLQGITKEQ